MTKQTDTSKEAVQRLVKLLVNDAEQQHVKPCEMTGLPPDDEYTIAETVCALAAERDAAVARADAAEAMIAKAEAMVEEARQAERDEAVARADIAGAMVAEALWRAEELANIHSEWAAEEIMHYRTETRNNHRAALDRMLREEREKAMRDAAALADSLSHDGSYVAECILALIDQMKGDTP